MVWSNLSAQWAAARGLGVQMRPSTPHVANIRTWSAGSTPSAMPFPLWATSACGQFAPGPSSPLWQSTASALSPRASLSFTSASFSGMVGARALLVPLPFAAPRRDSPRAASPRLLLVPQEDGTLRVLIDHLANVAAPLNDTPIPSAAPDGAAPDEGAPVGRAPVGRAHVGGAHGGAPRHFPRTCRPARTPPQ